MPREGRLTFQIEMKSTAQNWGVRARFRLIKGVFPTTVVMLRHNPLGNYSFSLSDTRRPYIGRFDTQPQSRKTSLLHGDSPIPEEHDFTLELVAVDAQMIGRCDGEVWGPVAVPETTRGKIMILSLHPVRDIEVINLDGISPGVAQKAAGLP